MSDLEKADELAGLVELFLGNLDEEMAHGDYHAPDTVPPDFDDEGAGYYDKHRALVEAARSSRAAVERCISEIRNQEVLGMKMNYCTAVIAVNPEVKHHDGLSLRYLCEKGLNLVRGCRYYHPMKCADGTVCEGECQHFNNGCRSKSAHDDARRRARKLVRIWLSD